MRLAIAALVLAGLPVVATPQPLGSPMPLPPIGLPLPPIASSLPPFASPRPPLGLPPVTKVEPDANKARPMKRDANRHRRPDRRSNGSRHPSFVYVIPPYGFYGAPWVPAGTPPPGFYGGWSPFEYQESAPPDGILRIEVEPEAVLQLYVDGSYIGTPADFRGEVTLEPGIHAIEIRAPGYEPLHFDANIAPGRSITYRGSLTPVNVPPPPRPTVQAPDIGPRTPMIVYFIPGCYAGNVPPQDAGLPATCDPRRVITFTP